MAAETNGNNTTNASNTLQTTTYSQWNSFRNCRKLCELRYVRGLVPIQRDDALTFGSLIHECLQIYHGTHDMGLVREKIDYATNTRGADPNVKFQWHLAHTMMEGYAVRYPSDNFQVIALEKTFTGDIINPETGAKSRTFQLRGKVDGLILTPGETGGYYLLEHKTTSSLDGGYLEKLWTDFQIILYSHYLEETLGISIAGIAYNVLVKSKLVQSAGETEEEFEQRRADLIAKSSSGKSSAKRKLPESDEDFRARLTEKYADPAMFHRELLFISKDQYRELQSELWELTQAYLDARRRNVWYKNTNFCFHWNKPCAYFAFCRSGENPLVAENLYCHEEAHGELIDGAEGCSASAPLVF